MPARPRNAPPPSLRPASPPPRFIAASERLPVSDLLPALEDLREALSRTRYPLDLPGVDETRRTAAGLLGHVEGHLLPRLRRLDSPLLVVVAGSTGAGKSTLVNSLVRAPASPTGVLRPTTRAPVLVTNPTDSPWFAERLIMPGLPIVVAPELDPGLALVDAPDMDSLLDENRDQARHLMAKADLWLFVTSAERYADVGAWEALRVAKQRGTPLAVVLDRVPPEDAEDLSGDLGRLLRAEGLAEARLFVVPESTLDGTGMLDADQLAEVRAWLGGMARDVALRAVTARQGLLGPVQAVQPRAGRLAAAAADQVEAAGRLTEAVRRPFAEAAEAVCAAVTEGALLQGAAREPWKELVVGGDLRRAVYASGGGMRGRLASRLPVRPEAFQDGVQAALSELLAEAVRDAEARATAAWAADPAGAALSPGAASDGDAAEQVAADWGRWLASLAQVEGVTAGTPRRGRARSASVAELLATIAVAAPPTGDVQPPPARRLVAAVREDGTATVLADLARDELRTRVAEHLAAAALRFRAPLDAVGVDPAAPERLSGSADRAMAAIEEPRA